MSVTMVSGHGWRGYMFESKKGQVTSNQIYERLLLRVGAHNMLRKQTQICAKTDWHNLVFAVY